MSKMNEMKYEKGLVNKYDIETSATIEQAAEASFKAIISQLGLSEAEVYKTCQDQLKRLTELQRENSTLKENLRLAKMEIAEEKLKKLKEEREAEQETVESWGGY